MASFSLPLFFLLFFLTYTQKDALLVSNFISWLAIEIAYILIALDPELV